MKLLSTMFASFLFLIASQAVLAQAIENFALEPISLDAKDSGDFKFELKDHRDKTIVLHFLLKTECPFCLRYTQEYTKLGETTPEVIHLFIKPDSQKEILSWARKLPKSSESSTPRIFRDPDAKFAKQLKIPDGYQFHGQSVHYPALVVLNGEGKELFRYVGKSNSDRLPTEEFSKRLEAVIKK